MSGDLAKRQRRRAELDALKMARGGCEEVLDDGTRCGWNRHPAGLQWDHRDGTKSHSGNAIRPSWSWDRIFAEVAKCDLVCACCHAIRTARRGYQGGHPMHRNPRRAAPRVRKARPRAAACAQGHSFDDENTYQTPAGVRRCRACDRDRKARYRAEARLSIP